MIAGIVYEHSSKAQITQCTKYWCFSVNLLVISLINSKCNHSPCKQILFVMTCLRLQFYCFHHFAVSATGMQADLVSMAKKYLVIILSDSDGAVLVPNCLYPIHKTVGDAIWFIYIYKYTNGLAALLPHWNLPVMWKIMKCSHIFYLLALQQSWVAFDPLYLDMLSLLQKWKDCIWFSSTLF